MPWIPYFCNCGAACFLSHPFSCLYEIQMCIFFFQGGRMVLFLESKKPLHADVKWRDSYVWWGWLQPKCFDDKLDVISPCKYVTCNHYFGGKSCTSTFLVLLVTHSNLERSDFNHAHFWQTCKMNQLFSSKSSQGFHAEGGGSLQQDFKIQPPWPVSRYQSILSALSTHSPHAFPQWTTMAFDNTN